MTRAINAAVFGALLLWWAPTIALAVIRAVPHFIAIRGRLYRIRRAHRLIDRGRAREARRVIIALRFDRGAEDRR